MRRSTLPNVPSHYSISHDNAPNGLLAILEELSDSENVPTPFASIALFNARKYLLRAPRKNGLEDLVKCRDYLERCIAIYESDLKPIKTFYVCSRQPDVKASSLLELIDRLECDYHDLMLVRRQVVEGIVYLCYDYTSDSNNQS